MNQTYPDFSSSSRMQVSHSGLYELNPSGSQCLSISRLVRKQVVLQYSLKEIILLVQFQSTKMSPLEFFLFLTFLIYTYYYKFILFVFYLLLIVAYFIYCMKTSKSVDGINTSKQKLLTAAFSNPDEGCAHLVYEFDVTQSIPFAAKLSKENEIPVTITHVALRALALGIRESQDIQGVLKWGNFEHDDNVGLTTLVNIDQGKDLVPIHIKEPTKVNVLEIARRTNKMVEKARQKKDKAHNKRYQYLPYLPTYMIRLGTIVSSYIINQLNVSIESVGFKARDFGNALVSNVGVFGMKRGFAPLIEQSGCSILIAMGKVEKRAVVRNNEIVIRSMMNFNFVFDNRYAPLESLRPCYQRVRIFTYQLKQYFLNPESFEK